MVQAKPLSIPTLAIQHEPRTIDALVPKQTDAGVWYQSVVMTAFLQSDGTWHVYDIEKGGHPVAATTVNRVSQLMREKAGLA